MQMTEERIFKKMPHTNFRKHDQEEDPEPDIDQVRKNK